MRAAAHHTQRALPILALLGSMASIQLGAALAQSLFPAIGAQGTTALRVTMAALILLAIHRPSPRALDCTIVLYGLSLGVMNLLFYLSLRTVPLGVAVAVEFTGPLALSALSHRGRLDILWLVLAAGGLIALAPFGSGAVDPAGLLLALGAGLFWALYILFGQKAGQGDAGVATSLGMAVAALVALPFGVMYAGSALIAPAHLPIALAVAVLSSALPYSLEMFALTRLPRPTFGTLMSLEPAAGAIAGWVLLGQHLTLRQDLAIVAIIAASCGAASGFLTGNEARDRVPMP
jgi:inner membrane transporter RhtA